MGGSLGDVDPKNVQRCPTCGDIRRETPPGTIALPTFGTAMKNAQGAAGACDCGRRRLDEIEHEPSTNDGG